LFEYSVRKVVLRAKEVKIEFARTAADDQENESIERVTIPINLHKCGGQTQIIPAKGSTLLHLKHSPIRTSGDGNENVFGRCSRLDGDAVAPFETADRKIWDSVGPDWPPKNRTDWSVRFAAKSSLTGRTLCPEDEALFDCGDH
jgi:hypothetical protein